MEYTPESILAQLEAGRSADDIAAEFTRGLNDALDLQKEKEKEAKAAAEARKLADAKREAEKAEADRKHQAQLRDTEDLLDHFFDYMADYYPETKLELGTAEDLVKMLDAWAKFSVTLDNTKKKYPDLFKDGWFGALDDLFF